MIAKPNLDDILNTVLNKITNETGITNIEKGSISRILTESYLTEIVNLYNYVDQAVTNMSVSTATGPYLDLKGALLQCTRSDGAESDENYRYRITKQPAILARENLDDLELALLSIDGIKKVYIDEYACGGGSFDVYVFGDQIDLPDSVISKAESTCYQHKAFGVMGNIKQAEKLYVGFDLLIKPKTANSKVAINELVSQYLKNAIDNMNVGESVNFSLIIEELNKTIGTNTIIIDEIKINNTPIYNYSSFNLSPYARLVFDDVVVTIIE